MKYKLLNRDLVNNAIALLLDNKKIILPTDTIYGISAIVSDANEKAINKIKSSPESKPLIILISNLAQADLFVNVDDIFLENVNVEDPTTLISKKMGSEKTYALRLVKRPDLKTIIDTVGPIFSTSVNHSGCDFLTKKSELENFSEEISHVFYVGDLGKKPSKILNLLDFSKKRWQL